MLRFIKSIFIFIPFAVFIYIITICLWGDYAPPIFKRNLIFRRIGSEDYLSRRIYEVSHTKNVDILFLGSSHTYRGFDNRIFKKAGFKTFNLGSSAQTPIQTEVLLKKYLIQLNPRCIILEVSPGVFASDGVESSIDLITNVGVDKSTLDLAIKHNKIKVYNSLIYAFYKSFFYTKIEYNNCINSKCKGHTYINGGFVQKDISFFKNVVYQNITKYDIRSDQLNSFEHIVKIAKMHNIRLILVQSPITHSFYNSFSNNVLFDKTMCDYGEYYNFNHLITLNDSLNFYDNLHLNQNGVEIFNKKLIDFFFVRNRKRAVGV